MENPPEEYVFDDLVTIARFSFSYQAHLLAGNLEAEGIEAFIHGENMASVYPFLVNDNNGIRVQVRESEAEAAKAIMNRIAATAAPSADLPVAIRIDKRLYDLVNGNCQECGEASVYLARSSAETTIGAVAMIVTLSMPMRLEHNYFCHTCQAMWKA